MSNGYKPPSQKKPWRMMKSGPNNEYSVVINAYGQTLAQGSHEMCALVMAGVPVLTDLFDDFTKEPK